MDSLASGSSQQKLTKHILSERNENLNSVAETFVGELERVQQQIVALDTEANEKKARVVLAYENSRKPICDKRNNLIKNISNFWIKTFENHPEIRSLVDRETGERLRFLNRFEVQSIKDTPSKFSFKLNFFFNENPYFENDVLSKEVVVKDDDTFSCTNSTIRWKTGKKSRGKMTKLSSISRKRKFESGTFFDWFESNPRHDTFADCFRELHQRPLRYFSSSNDDDDDSDSYYDDDEETDVTDDERDGYVVKLSSTNDPDVCD